MQITILILEPQGQSFARLARDFRAEAGPEWVVTLVATVDELLLRLAEPSRHCLVILPVDLGGRHSGLELIPRIHQVRKEIPVVVTADKGNVDLAARAIQAGANDFLVHGERLRRRIGTLLGKLRGLFEIIDRSRVLDQSCADLREMLQAQWKIIGASPQIKRLLAQIDRVAKVPRPVLILGERGTGKELVARAIHAAGGNGARPMISVNCAAFNDALLESELFGHEKGAFTGAEQTRRGKFELADRGTLFLDEIGNMSLPFQEKILRVVEYGTFSRVGGSEELKTSARIIAATNQDLKEKIANGEFQADLYDRLAFETLHMPALRERREDIAFLAQYFLDQFAKETPAFGGKRLSPTAIQALQRYSFPGNVRELKNIIERAAYRDIESEITPEDLGLLEPDELLTGKGSFEQKVHAFSRRLITGALHTASGNQAQAARDLGLSYHQFRYYVKKYVPKTAIRDKAQGGTT
jgi:DNA-binding NtrC family response regulator